MSVSSLRLWFIASLIVISLTRFVGATEESAAADGMRVFSGEPRLLIVHGYSTSAHWWAFLQRKIDRYMDGPEKRVVEVQLCNKGGTPIARWIDLETGMPSQAWQQMFTPMIQQESGQRPVIVLAQQSLQGVFAESFATGIRNNQDLQRIERGADAIEQYANLMLKDGAAAVLVGMHIYKVGMEPQIGNERLALAELMKRRPARIHAGPDTWTPTSIRHPLAFAKDKRHPNFIGAEIMAHYWFESLLKRDGLKVPAWSLQEMEKAVQEQPAEQSRGRAFFQQKLKEWRIVSRKPAPPRRERKRQSNENGL